MSHLAKRTRAAQARAVVGVDAGKYHHALVVRPRGGADSRALTIPTTRAGFDEAVAFIDDRSGGAPTADVLVGLEFAGNYGFTFAHYLHQRGFPIVSVLPSHTKRWKEVTHHLPLKTDAKDALGITDLTAQGHFVGFPFLALPYAELRYLVSARERLLTLHRGTLTRLRTILHVVFPEFEQLMGQFTKRTPLALLAAFPGPDVLATVPLRRVTALLETSSRGQLGREMAQALRAAARGTLGLPSAQGVLKDEIPLLLEQYHLVQRQRCVVERRMVDALEGLPETPALLSVPMVAPVTAAVFLGAVGDPQSYESAREILRVAGLSLVEHSSGLLQGRHRIAKRGRPTLRAAAYLFAVRSIRHGGLFRAEYEGLLARNGGNRMKAVVAVSRSALRLLFSVARDRRLFTTLPPARGRVPVH
ncbi:MAG: IS110 family transposase [Gemmatimonadota bacterium]|nr:IS110 family transposase [Gemmatimonadota bacterium]MDH5198380.1 IS110 family transposase [Gemmatimonadota bacterium]